jgi:hypothetical protein
VTVLLDVSFWHFTTNARIFPTLIQSWVLSFCFDALLSSETIETQISNNLELYDLYLSHLVYVWKLKFYIPWNTFILLIYMFTFDIVGLYLFQNDSLYLSYTTVHIIISFRLFLYLRLRKQQWKYFEGSKIQKDSYSLYSFRNRKLRMCAIEDKIDFLHFRSDKCGNWY